jgi:hypothetical protein
MYCLQKGLLAQGWTLNCTRSSPKEQDKDMTPCAPSIDLMSDFERNTSGPISERDWTGLYAITILVVNTDIEAARDALPDGLELNPEYAQGSQYPILMSFGSILNARPRVGGSIGLNYLEVFSAIPGVRLRNQPQSGPFLHCYTGYLNHIIPVLLGRIAGYRKFLKRISLTHGSTTVHGDGFEVKQCLSGRTILSAKFQASRQYEPALKNKRVKLLSTLIPPDIIGVDLFGRLIRTKFQFLYGLGSARDITAASVTASTKNFIPGRTGPIQLGDVSSFSWDERYLPARLFVPWRLQEKHALQIERVARAAPVPAPSKTRQAGAARSQ